MLIFIFFLLFSVSCLFGMDVETVVYPDKCLKCALYWGTGEDMDFSVTKIRSGDKVFWTTADNPRRIPFSMPCGTPEKHGEYGICCMRCVDDEYSAQKNPKDPRQVECLICKKYNSDLLYEKVHSLVTHGEVKDVINFSIACARYYNKDAAQGFINKYFLILKRTYDFDAHKWSESPRYHPDIDEKMIESFIKEIRTFHMNMLKRYEYYPKTALCDVAKMVSGKDIRFAVTLEFHREAEKLNIQEGELTEEVEKGIISKIRAGVINELKNNFNKFDYDLGSKLNSNEIKALFLVRAVQVGCTEAEIESLIKELKIDKKFAVGGLRELLAREKIEQFNFKELYNLQAKDLSSKEIQLLWKILGVDCFKEQLIDLNKNLNNLRNSMGVFVKKIRTLQFKLSGPLKI